MDVREEGCDKQNKIRERDKHTWFGPHIKPVKLRDLGSQENIVEVRI